MQQVNAPVPLVTPFAETATGVLINNVPLVPYGGQPAGQVAYSTGFTAVNFTAIASGGIPPWGADLNGLLFNATTAQIWQQAGYLFHYNGTFSTGVGGYPIGGRVAMASGLGAWLSTVDNNTTNPDTTGAAGWVAQPANQGATTVSGITGGSVTLTGNQLGAPLLVLTGTLTSNAQVILGLPTGATYTVQNLTTGAFTLTVGGATGSAVTIAQGVTNGQTVYCDGTNWYTSQFNGAGVYLPITGTAVAANKLATARSIAASGAVVWSVTFDGSANVTAAATLGATGVTAGTYGSSTQVPQLTVGTDGRISAVTNVTASVTSVFGRTGAVVLTLADINGIAGGLALTQSLSTTGTITAAQNFISSSTNAVLAATGSGQVYLRPNGAGSTTGQTTVNSAGLMSVTTSGQSTTLALNDTGSNGANLALNGNGGTTPNKSIRAASGLLQFVNSAYSAVVSSMSDTGAWTLGGAAFGSADASGVTDLSKHISLYGGVIGFSVTSSRLNYVVPSANTHVFNVAGVDVFTVSASITATAGQVQSTGTTAGFQFADRTTTTNSFQWYATSATARLYYSPSGDRLTIDGSGNLTAVGTITPGSDERVKANLVKITNALATIRVALVGVEYDRIDQDMKPDAGFIAQRVKEHLSRLVPVRPMGDIEDFHSMNYNGALAYTTNAVVELHDIVLRQAKVIARLWELVGDL